MDGFCKVFRKELCQILVVGIDDIVFDRPDFFSIHFGKHGKHFFPFVLVRSLRTFPYGGIDDVDAIGGIGACHWLENRTNGIGCFRQFIFGEKVLSYDFHAQVSHTGTERNLAQICMFGTKVVEPLRVIMQPDEFPCQFLVLVFGDIFPDAVQKKRHGFQVVFDISANILAVCPVTVGSRISKRFRKFQAVADNV